MANDAQVSSLSEHGRSPEQRVSDLEAILPHLAQTALKAERELAEFKQEAEGRRAQYQETVGRLLARIGEIGGEVEANRARIGVCLANSASATARAELAIEEARKAARDELLAIAEVAGEDDGPRHGPSPKRDRHGLHLVRDAAGGTAALAALFSFLRSPLARGTHRAVSLAMVGALGAAGTVAGPSLLAPSPSPAHAAAVVPAHHGHHHARWRASMLNVDPPDAPVHHARHRHAVGVVPAASPSASPGASGQPAPSPAPTLPVAVPSPTLPVVPPPLPSPSPTACHGKHCHGGDDLGQVLSGLLPRWDH